MGTLTEKFVSSEYKDMIGLAKKLAPQYQNALPFENIMLPNFFNPDILENVLNEFPNLTGDSDKHFDKVTEKKRTSVGENRFKENTLALMHYLNSETFLTFLQELSGIRETLIPDPSFAGGGFHQIERNGFLKIHADFNKHPKTKLDRRVNVLVYLNKDWQEEWGGHLELWNRDMTQCEVKIPPLFNTLAMFTTTDFSYHGHPDPLLCPADRSRKSLALYYYSNGRPAHEIEQNSLETSTKFRARKNNASDAVLTRDSSKPTLLKRALRKLMPR